MLIILSNPTVKFMSYYIIQERGRGVLEHPNYSPWICPCTTTTIIVPSKQYVNCCKMSWTTNLTRHSPVLNHVHIIRLAIYTYIL